MTLDEMNRIKKELGYSNEKISQLSGVPFSTVQKVLSGKTESPRQKTVEAIVKVLEAGKGINYKDVLESQKPYSMLGEAAPAYAAKKQGEYTVKKQGEYTMEDYFALPDERRVELIDGEIFDMAAPSARHQLILGEMYVQFKVCASVHGLPCRVFLSPCDVQLDNDDKTMVQPDLFVLCREFDISKHTVAGAPDLTVEILSDSTRAKDMLLKTYKYKNAGVRE